MAQGMDMKEDGLAEGKRNEGPEGRSGNITKQG
jgi:hypothetical protein